MTTSIFLAGCLWIAPSAAAQATSSTESAAPASEPAPVPHGLLPIPDYTGDLLTRRYLTGDWGGTRSDWADNGIQFSAEWTQTLQGIVDGGTNTTTRYGGSLNYDLLLDLDRMNVLRGALIKVRAESRYADSINGFTGQLLPANTDALFPLTSTLDDDIPITVTNLTYFQYLSAQFGLMLGKFDTLDGDLNEFASGRGTSQFLNANFVFNSVGALTVPYSTLGGGVVWMPRKNIHVSSAIFNTVDSSTTSGFDDFGDGWTWSTEARFQYRLGDLPGGQNVALIYASDGDYTKIGGRLIFQPGQGIIVPTKDDTWAAYWSAWQYVHTLEPVDEKAAIHLENGEPDLRGLGFFARYGIADEDTNPVEWSFSGGIGGKGMLNARPHDTFGAGYFYTSIVPTRVGGFLGLDDNTQGLEAYYNFKLSGHTNLTLDLQALESAEMSIDTALILGARLRIVF